MASTTMWAMRLAGPYAFMRTQVAVPTPGDLDDGQVLLRVIAGGICGSDIPYFRGVHPIPEVPGLAGRLSAELPGFPMHEVVGEVVASRHPETAVGSYVVGWARGMNGLALQVQEALRRDPHAGDLFVFRGARGDLIKIIWHDGQGACLFTKRLERGRFLWPSLADGVVTVSVAQLSYLLSGIDWRMPQATWRPQASG